MPDVHVGRDSDIYLIHHLDEMMRRYTQILILKTKS